MVFMTPQLKKIPWNGARTTGNPVYPHRGSSFVWNKNFKRQSSSSLCCFHLVSDIDECSSENECHVNATCTNTIGSYSCMCKKGYEGDGTDCSGKVQSYQGNITTDADSSFLFFCTACVSFNDEMFWHVDFLVIAKLFCLE